MAGKQENKQEKTSNHMQSSDVNKCGSCAFQLDSLSACLIHEATYHLNPNKKTNEIEPRKKIQTQRLQNKSPSNDYAENITTAILSQCPEGKELDYLRLIFQPTPEELLYTYQNVFDDLKANLMNVYNQLDIIPFGSKTLEMIIKSSDLDFYVYPKNLRLNKYNSDDVFKKVLKALKRNKQFSKIIPIPNAKVPIIKCIHIKTKCKIDINTSSLSGVLSNNFIKKLFELDSRIHPLMLIIKMWAQYWNVTRNTRKGYIANYNLVLMVIAFLQNMKSPKILPSIQELQNNKNKKFLQGINFAFNEDYSNENSKKNNKNIKELIYEFFEFYSKFDFSSYIISPYLGEMINRNDFLNKKFKSPQYGKMSKYFEKKNFSTKGSYFGSIINLDSPIIIQDPFCLKQNTSVTEKGFDKLKQNLENGYRICLKYSANSCSEFLFHLFSKQSE